MGHHTRACEKEHDEDESGKHFEDLLYGPILKASPLKRIRSTEPHPNSATNWPNQHHSRIPRPPPLSFNPPHDQDLAPLKNNAHNDKPNNTSHAKSQNLSTPSSLATSTSLPPNNGSNPTTQPLSSVTPHTQPTINPNDIIRSSGNRAMSTLPPTKKPTTSAPMHQNLSSLNNPNHNNSQLHSASANLSAPFIPTNKLLQILKIPSNPASSNATTPKKFKWKRQARSPNQTSSLSQASSHITNTTLKPSSPSKKRLSHEVESASFSIKDPAVELVQKKLKSTNIDDDSSSSALSAEIDLEQSRRAQ